MKLRNANPTTKEEAAMRDVLSFPADSLADRAARLKVTRGGVLHLLRRLALKGMAAHNSVNPCGWEILTPGRAWLRPTMATRRASTCSSNVG